MTARWRGAFVSILCALALAACGGFALVMPLADPASARNVARFMIFVGGIAEIVLGRFGPPIERGRTGVVLGLLSMGTGSLLILAGATSALSLTLMLSAWLLARAVVELVGGWAGAVECAGLVTARLARGTVDLVLGLLALIGSLATAFPAFLLGWPWAVVRMILLFVAISLIASAALHAGLVFAFGGAHRPRRPRFRNPG
jgi:uncharacterized membrane protein HdeD (DUF308 family)